MSIRDEARKIRPIIEEALTSIDDSKASQAVSLFPKLKNDGQLIASGTRIDWKGQLKRASVDLWDTTSNNPDNAPTLWEDIKYIDGYRIIDETLTVGTAFQKGEIGWWKDELYISVYDGMNIWIPEQYAPGWEIYTGG